MRDHPPGFFALGDIPGPVLFDKRGNVYGFHTFTTTIPILFLFCNKPDINNAVMKKLIVVAGIFAIGVFSLWYYTRHPLVTTVTVRNTSFAVDVAVTRKEKEVGLGFRDSLAPDRGMLFVYDHKEVFPFWMKNMRFPIDIIWIDDRTIVDISKNVPVSDKPVGELPIYHPIVPVDKVLEVNAGVTDTYNIAIGDKVVIKN